MSRPADEVGGGRLTKSSPYAVWTLACAGLLALGGFLESSLAEAHRVSVESLSQHPDASLIMAKLILAGAALCGAWPASQAAWRAIRRGRLTWHVVIVVIVAGTFSLGHMFEAGAIALGFSVGLTLMSRRRARD